MLWINKSKATTLLSGRGQRGPDHTLPSLTYAKVLLEIETSPNDRWVDRWNVVHPCNRVFFSLKRRGNRVTSHHTYEPGGHHAERWSQSQEDTPHVIPLAPRASSSQRQRVEGLLPSWGQGRGSSWDETEFQFCQMRRWRWLHKNTNAFNAAEPHTWKWLQRWILCFVPFTTCLLKRAHWASTMRGALSWALMTQQRTRAPAIRMLTQGVNKTTRRPGSAHTKSHVRRSAHRPWCCPKVI